MPIIKCMRKINYTKITAVVILQLVFFSSVFSQNLNEQKDEIKIYGTVYDKTTLDSLPFTSVVVNKGKGFITDDKGSFLVTLSKGDTLQFSHIGYFDTEFQLIGPEISNITYISVYLEARNYDISEAVIMPYKTYEEFKQAVIDLDLDNNLSNNVYTNFDVLMYQYKTGYVPDNDGYTNYCNTIRTIQGGNGYGYVNILGIIPAIKQLFDR